MKRLIPIVMVFLAPLSIPARAETILRCTGFNKQLNGEIDHYVVIEGAKAMMDEQAFAVTSTPVTLVLDRPGVRMRINRTDGSYVILDPSDFKVNDWSKPDEKGCVAVKAKF